jgi:hypothetical protein
MPRRARLTTSSVAASAVVVAVAAFGLGFVAAYDPDGARQEVATVTTSTSEAPDETTTTEAPPTTARAETTTTAAPTTTTTLVPSTLAPTTTLPAPTTALPTTTAPVEPPRLVVSYPRNGAGQMVIRAGGSAPVILQNAGTQAAGFRVQTNGAVTVTGSNDLRGTLAAGQVLTLPIVASANPPAGPGPHGRIGIFSDVGLVVSIDVLVQSG